MSWLQVFVQTMAIILVVVTWSEILEHIRFQRLKRHLTEALWDRIEKRMCGCGRADEGCIERRSSG